MRRVVVVTDGDCKALAAVERAAENVGARCISLTGCRHRDDARWTPEEVEELVLSTPRDPVILMVDDEGRQGEGWGEQILRRLCNSQQLKVVGVVAVASNMDGGTSVDVDLAVTADGQVVQEAVDKEGKRDALHRKALKGDTVENIHALEIPRVIGLGDPGKMNFADDAKAGAPITTKAIEMALQQERVQR